VTAWWWRSNGLCTWYWLADLCAQEGMPCGLGHALAMNASPGGIATHEKLDSHPIAVLRRGGMRPQASVYPAARRATRDLLRRRIPLMPTRAALWAQGHHTHSQDHLPEIGKTIASKANRDGVAARFADPAGPQSRAVDLALIPSDDQLLPDLERSLVQSAKQHDANPCSRRRAVPGVGKMLARVLLARHVRWLPERHFIFVGDSGSGTSETARFCQQHHRHLTLVSKCYGDAALYEPPPPRTRRTMGRPRVKGQKLASPQEVVARPAQRTSLRVAWYGGSTRDIEIVTGTGHWSRMGEALAEVRWLYVHDGTGTHRDESCLTTDITMRPQQMVECYTQPWSMETTFQECREYLKLESSKSYGKQAVLRFTPCLFGRYTVVVLLLSAAPALLKHSRCSLLEGQIDGDLLPYDDVCTPWIMGAVVFSHTG
jgi:hypothetical protein